MLQSCLPADPPPPPRGLLPIMRLVLQFCSLGIIKYLQGLLNYDAGVND